MFKEYSVSERIYLNLQIFLLQVKKSYLNHFNNNMQILFAMTMLWVISGTMLFGV